ncbi:MAG: AI-2E family transporter [Pseudomonadota bacterium]
MEDPATGNQPMTAREFTDSLIRIALIMFLVLLCFRVFSPFMSLMIWAVILAVTLYPVHQFLASRLGGKQGRAATFLVLSGLMLVGVPIVLLSASMAQYLAGTVEAYNAGTLNLRPPNEKVAEWPVIGEDVYNAWDAAYTNLPAFIAENRAGLETFMAKMLASAKATAGSVLGFLGSLIVAGIMMAYGKSGSEAVLRILNRVAGPVQGPAVHTLSTMTTRSVAVGVLGVALIQALLLGMGFIFAGVPAAGPLAVLTLFLGIMQLPALLVSLPAILWIWNSGDASTVMNIVWTVYLLVAGASDGFLKPILLGRGVDAPMPVILIGALGGMVSSGFIGLFTGAVILAVGYQIFMQWVDWQDEKAEAAAAAADPGPEAAEKATE